MPRTHSSEPIATFKHRIPAGRIEDFFESVLWQLPKRPDMPPTLATIFRQGEFLALQKLNIPLQKVLHGEQKYRFIQDLREDTEYQGETLLQSHFEKKGGAGGMGVYVFMTHLKDPSGAPCVECVSTIIVR